MINNLDWNTLSGESVPDNKEFVLVGIDESMAGNKMINVAEIGRKMDIRKITVQRVHDVIAERVAGNVDLFKIMKGLFLEHRFTSMGHSREVLRDDIIEYMAKLKPGKSISLPVGFNLRLKKMRVKNDPDIISEIRGVFKDIVGMLIKVVGVHSKGHGSKDRGVGRKSHGRGRHGESHNVVGKNHNIVGKNHNLGGKNHNLGGKNHKKSHGCNSHKKSHKKGHGCNSHKKGHNVGVKVHVKSKKNNVLGIAGKNGSVRGVENNIVTRGPSLGMGGQFRAMADAQRLEHARMIESQRKFDALPCETKLQIAMNTIMDLEEELYESNKKLNKYNGF